MKLSLDQFWRLTVASRIIEPDECETLRQEFLEDNGRRGNAGSRAAAAWLIKRHRLTPYQANILLKGQAGRFQFGEYRILRTRPTLNARTRRFDGIHVGTHHRVLLHFLVNASENEWEWAQQQSEVARRIRHPNLDRVYETVASGDYRLCVSECPQGRTLHDLLRQRKRLAPPHACLLAQQLATALGHLHAMDVVHGNVRPEEAEIQPNNHVRLLRQPFGQPRTSGDTIDPSAPTSTAFYLAPEFVRPESAPDSLTDIYALGCLLYELLAGRPPFERENVEEIMAAHATQRIEPLDDVATMPNGLMEVVSFMMAKRRELRYPDMTEVSDKLNAFVPSGIRQRTPRARATESYYLAHLERAGQKIPQHLKSFSGGRSSDEADRSVAAATPEPTIIQRADNGQDLTEEEVAPDLAATPSAARGQRQGQRPVSRRPLILVVTAVLAVIVLAMLLQLWSLRTQGGNGEIAGSEDSSNPYLSEAAPPEQSVSFAATKAEDPATSDGSKSREQNLHVTLVEDDGQTLWVSPTSAPPIELNYSPPGAQLFLHIRPAALVESLEGQAVLQALGPDFAARRDEFEKRLGVPFDQIDQLLLSSTGQDVGPPLNTCLIRMNVADCQRIRERSDEQRATAMGQLARLEGLSVFFPSAAPDTLILGEPSLLAEVATRTGTLPLRRQLETLRRRTDVERHVTVLFAPNFLASDGRFWLSGSREILRQPLLDFLGDSTQAACFSLHFDGGTYAELRWISSVDQNALPVAVDGRQKLRQFPERLSGYLGGIRIDPYWQPLAIRLPLMVHFLTQHVRAGVDDSEAVLNVVLPPGAAHNLILAAELSTSSSRWDRRPPVDQTPPVLTIDQILGQRMTLQIEQQSLEIAMQEFRDLVRQQSSDRRFQIRIIGKDLQLDGITRNQQIRQFFVENQPVRRILTELVQRANPTRSSGPAQPDQKLVWVVSPDDPAGVLITTRTAARQKGYPLPREFVAELTP